MGIGAVKIEVLFADRHGHALEGRIIVLPDPFDVGKLSFGVALLPGRRNRRVVGPPESSPAGAELGT